ncbi:MAG: hypothetical protein CL433_10580 [Acidimicrobiaceae bacterium]|jgi:hypothetical protein|nr:hypothetical protein [Acidimicrobiaceae bacterium]HAB57923.1 hypothetical protein [Acidimicrobiaceae bacterium]|tara:strand:+ start:717 stop:1193 length:477 start_codon:yes stop_codon:yes gene_type:complete
MRVVAWACALSLLVVGCDGNGAATTCVELREPEDQASGRHVLSGGTVEYQTDPPTSGPHIAGPTPAGVLDDGVPPEIQVRVLESGGVIVQYDESVVGTELEQLRSVGSLAIVVAPAASELPARIIATAWTWKLSCSAVDLRTLEDFAAERSADAPGLD